MTKQISSFNKIYDQVLQRYDSESNVKALLPEHIKTNDALVAQTDDRYLSEITKSVFRAGFVWKVIENKWPNFEEVFYGFDIETCRNLSPERLDQLCSDERIVRNRQKILTVPRNAGMVADIIREHGSFGRFIAEWPPQDFFGLLNYFKKHGERMGGNSCQYFLRFVGKDGFMLTPDVVRALINAKVIEKAPTTKGAKQAVQDAFNQWQEESELGIADISKLLALSIG